METEHIERANEIAQEMIKEHTFIEQNEMLKVIKDALMRDRADHMEQSKQAMIDLKKLK